MRDRVDRDPMHPDLPEHFREACISIFHVPMDESRLFVARTWLSEPHQGDLKVPTPACLVLSAERVDSARMVAACIREILDYVYAGTIEGTLSPEEVVAIKATLRKRCNLLDLNEASSLFGDIGVPIFFPGMDMADPREILVMPLVETVGFDPGRIHEQTMRTPNKW